MSLECPAESWHALGQATDSLQGFEWNVWNVEGVVLQAGDRDPGRQGVMGAWVTAEAEMHDVFDRPQRQMEKAEGEKDKDR